MNYVVTVWGFVSVERELDVFKNSNELEVIMDIIFYWVGVVVCCGLGLFVTGFFIGTSVNYFWRKTKEAHDWIKLCSLIKEAKQAGKL